jgi:hypothetical protein
MGKNPETWKLKIGVTRSGEFSPNGRFFTMGSFTQITKVAQSFGILLHMQTL